MSFEFKSRPSPSKGVRFEVKARRTKEQQLFVEQTPVTIVIKVEHTITRLLATNQAHQPRQKERVRASDRLRLPSSFAALRKAKVEASLTVPKTDVLAFQIEALADTKEAMEAKQGERCEAAVPIFNK
jgi:hypothetical protein